MKFNFYKPLALILTIFFAEISSAQDFQQSLTSPNGKISLTFKLTQGVPKYEVTYDGKSVVAPSALGLILPEKLGTLAVNEAGSGSEAAPGWTPAQVRSERQPLWGEYTVVPDAYNAATVTLRETSEPRRELRVEFRLYDEGLAFRYRFDTAQIPQMTGEATEFALSPDVGVFPISSTEATFPENAVPFEKFERTSPPLTGLFADGRAFCVMEAFAVSYPRFSLVKSADSRAVRVQVRETTFPKDAKDFCTPWRALMLAESPAKLVEHEYFIFNLNPPCAPAAAAWVVPGKTLSNACNCQIRTADLESMVDFAAENGIRYVQIDWGWYGTEWVYTDAECEEWAKNNPDKAADPTWRANTKPDPTRVANGLVPYFPRFRASTYVDIDIEKLVAYGRERGVGICLYLNDRMIKTHDIEELFTVYEKWGLAGLKPGFVAYGSAENTDEIRYLAETAAKHHLWLCIHDAFLPDGMAATYPHVMNVEGGGGQEGNHPPFHDTVLPFTRGLVGPFDFTPRLYQPGRSHTHQLSLLVTLYAPSHVIRGGWAIRNNTGSNAFGSELEFLRRVDVSWADTHVLDAEIGRRIVTVRKTKDGVWFLGATNGSEARTSTVSLSFLDPEVEYQLTLWTDDPAAAGDYRPTVKTTRIVRSTDSLALPMSANGGAVGILEKKP